MGFLLVVNTGDCSTESEKVPEMLLGGGGCDVRYLFTYISSLVAAIDDEDDLR